MVRNLASARAVWNRMTRILIREEAAPRVSGFSFKAVFLAVLLFSAETWVPPPPAWAVSGGVTGSGGAASDGAAPAAKTRWEIGV